MGHRFDESLEEAIKAIRTGRFIMIHDLKNREDEVDLVCHGNVEPEHIRFLRENGGGLICQSVRYDIGAKLGLTYLKEIMKSASQSYPILRALTSKPNPYGDDPAFSLTINHKDTYTGITDRDRATTIREFTKLCERALAGDPKVLEEFTSSFRSPGHIQLLLASEGLLGKRAGHTELSIYIMELAGLSPTAVVCEMLDGETHKALSSDKAEVMAEKMRIPYLEGEALLRHFKERRAL